MCINISTDTPGSCCIFSPSNQQTGSVSDSNDYQSGKVNPETGAEDFVGLAAAGAVAAAAAGAVLFRKRK